ncbi:cation:dicarboxylate symporter family transporter [Desulfovibrio desulfuricans]|uniref:cation:dicarboxylate symporter family transporter n=1 Tax=Desulfovibrio desulfuricans TaxID=876 RepID=UPI001B3B27E4|nr:cation:dicarboxylase symporter family transporter [Desulfovibrio desulfuricans]
MATTRAKRSFPLYAQILTGLVVGAVIGFAWPDFGKNLQPIGTAFIKAIKMIVIPLVFCAISLGISKMSKDIKSWAGSAGWPFSGFTRQQDSPSSSA